MQKSIVMSFVECVCLFDMWEWDSSVWIHKKGTRYEQKLLGVMLMLKVKTNFGQNNFKPPAASVLYA